MCYLQLLACSDQIYKNTRSCRARQGGSEIGTTTAQPSAFRNHHAEDTVQLVASTNFMSPYGAQKAFMLGFVAPDFIDAEVLPPKFLHGIEPSQVCRWRPRKRSSRAGGPRCEPSPQTAYGIRPDPTRPDPSTAGHPEIYFGILGC